MEFGSVAALSSLLRDCESAGPPQSEALPQRSLQSTQVTHGAPENRPREPALGERAIWAEEEIPSEDALADPSDDRQQAKFELLYKHDNVGVEDTFLGMSGKSIASTDSTHLVVKIYLQRARTEDVDLDVTKRRVRAGSRTHRMFTYLPVPVNHTKGAAKFDPKTSILSVTLPILQDEL